MYTEKSNDGTVTVFLDDDDRCEAFRDTLVNVYNSFSDPLEFCNEGAEVYLGNSYARYEFTALVDGFVYTYPFGPIEYDELRKEGKLELRPLFDNYLPDMPEWYRPEWAA